MKAVRDKRTYDQECGLAYALDVVGERWTLLIVRELLHQPCRYKELLDALPGIGTNLLAERLSSLTSAGIIEPTEPGRRTGGYVLSALGETLRDPVLGLARFGLAVGAGQPRSRESVTRASWAALAIEAMVSPERTAGVDETYEFHVDDEICHVSVEHGHPHTRKGPADQPTLTVCTDARTFFELGLRRLAPVEAVVSGAVTVTGTASAMPRCLRLIGLAP